MGWDGWPEQKLIFFNLRRKSENPCSFNKNRLLQGCVLEEPGAPWGLTFAPGILETCCEGVSSQAVNTSNSGSGGPRFKPCQSHCFLRQGIIFTPLYLSSASRCIKWVPVTHWPFGPLARVWLYLYFFFIVRLYCWSVWWPLGLKFCTYPEFHRCRALGSLQFFVENIIGLRVA